MCVWGGAGWGQGRFLGVELKPANQLVSPVGFRWAAGLADSGGRRGSQIQVGVGDRRFRGVAGLADSGGRRGSQIQGGGGARRFRGVAGLADSGGRRGSQIQGGGGARRFRKWQ